jgi:hypothetical protein
MGITSCSGKRKFFSEEVAQMHADEINLEKGYEFIFIYKCNKCNGYHLTHQKKCGNSSVGRA